MTEEEKSEISTKCRQLKLKSKDGKSYLTDTKVVKSARDDLEQKLEEKNINNKNSLNYQYIEDNKKIAEKNN